MKPKKKTNPKIKKAKAAPAAMPAIVPVILLNHELTAEEMRFQLRQQLQLEEDEIRVLFPTEAALKDAYLGMRQIGQLKEPEDCEGELPEPTDARSQELLNKPKI